MANPFLKPKVKDPSNKAHAYSYAMFLFNIRMRTEGEIKHSMEQRGYTVNVIEYVIRQMKEFGYINDKAYAETLVENFKKYRLYGYYLIKQKLLRKLLRQDLVEKILVDYLPITKELEIAKRVAEKNSLQNSQSYKGKQKLAYHLKMRGFRSEVISKIVWK